MQSVDHKLNKNIIITKFPHESTFGGEEIYTLRLFEELKNRGFNFSLLSSDEELIKKFKNRNWDFKRFNLVKEPITKKSTLFFILASPYLFFKILFQLFKFRFFKKTNYLYCLTFGEKLLSFVPALIFGYKIFWIEMVSVNHWLKKNPLNPFYKLYSKSKKVTILVPCELLKKELEENSINKNNIKVLHQGIDIKAYQIDESAFKTNKENFEIGTVLRLSKEKGAGYILQAIKETQSIIPNIQLTIVTDQTEKNNLQWLTKQLEIEHLVKIVNLQKNIAKWFKDFDIFVLANKKDFSLLSVLEAMVCGVPVIADETCGYSDAIANNVHGILTDTSNPDKISQAIVYLYNNPENRKQMILEAYKRVSTKFTLQKMVNDFYEFLLEKK